MNKDISGISDIISDEKAGRFIFRVTAVACERLLLNCTDEVGLILCHADRQTLEYFRQTLIWLIFTADMKKRDDDKARRRAWASVGLLFACALLALIVVAIFTPTAYYRCLFYVLIVLTFFHQARNFGNGLFSFTSRRDISESADDPVLTAVEQQAMTEFSCGEKTEIYYCYFRENISLPSGNSVPGKKLLD